MGQPTRRCQNNLAEMLFVQLDEAFCKIGFHLVLKKLCF
jgi:hypothetical protein